MGQYFMYKYYNTEFIEMTRRWMTKETEVDTRVLHYSRIAT
jgi:hypothetical protein